jgi:hypothetical protein
MVGGNLRRARSDAPYLAVRGKGLDEDGVGERLAESHAGVANLANDIVVAADQPDLRILDQAGFPQTVADFRPTGELLDAHAEAHRHTAQRAHRFAGTSALQNLRGR